MMLPAPALAGLGLPRGFVYLRDIDPTILQDIRYAGSHNFVGRPIKGYLAAECILSVPAANALAAVQRKLAEKKLSLIVWDCYRPKRAVDDFLAWSQRSGPRRNEGRILSANRKGKAVRARLSRNTIRPTRAAARWISASSRPMFHLRRRRIRSQPLKPCTRPKANGSRMERSISAPAYDCLDVLATTSNAFVGGTARRNRQTLKSYMREAGFRSYFREWWHFELVNEPFHDGFDFEVSASPSSNARPKAQP